MARKDQRAANERRARRAVAAVPPSELWDPPPIEECEQSVVPVQLDEVSRITMRRVEWNRQLVSYAVIYTERDSSGNWQEIACIDCCNNNVHRHDGPHGASDPVIIQPIYSQQNVQESFGTSYDAIHDTYTERRARR
jgi:hypothetical protein